MTPGWVMFFPLTKRHTRFHLDLKNEIVDHPERRKYLL